MIELLTSYEGWIRLVSFLSVFVFFIVLETIVPRRKQTQLRALRWTSNLSLVFISSVLLKAVALIIGINAAIYANTHQLGLFNNIDAPDIVAVIASIVLLDFVIYWQHRFSHEIPIIWRLHRLHHSDIEYDTTTALRFHPAEIILSYFVKFAAVLLIGVPVTALILFEIILNATAMFNHSNLKLPLGFDKILRQFIVTPDMHRVHHSVYPNETNSNYGFNIPLWDRLFGSYIAQPKDGHEQMEIGLYEFRSKKQQTLPALLKQPLE